MIPRAVARGSLLARIRAWLRAPRRARPVEAAPAVIDAPPPGTFTTAEAIDTYTAMAAWRRERGACPSCGGPLIRMLDTRALRCFDRARCGFECSEVTYEARRREQPPWRP